MNELLRTIVGRYSGVQHGAEWRCLCPAHNDSAPSLSCREVNDKVLWYCFAGCSQDQVAEAFRKDGVFNTSGGASNSWRVELPWGVPAVFPTSHVLKASGKTPGPDNQKLYSAHYVYRDRDGEILGFTVRYEREGKKEVIPFFRVGPDGRWRSGHTSADGRPIYSVHTVERNPDCEIWIVEGEKCADKFNAKGFEKKIGISWPGGSKSVKKSDWSCLAGKDVVVWCDFDAPGLSAGRDLLVVLAGVAGSVKFVDIEKTAEKEGDDCVDYFLKKDSLPSQFLSEPNKIKFKRAEVVKPESGGSSSPVSSVPHSKSSEVRFPLTEFGNVERFLARFPDSFLFSNEAGCHVWDGSRWIRDTKNTLKARAQEVIESIPDEITPKMPQKDREAIGRWAFNCQKASAVNAMAALISSQQRLQTSLSCFDTDPFILNCKNGIVDVRTGALMRHDKMKMCSHITNASYVVGSDCPSWKNFIDFTFNGDVEVIEYFHKAVGYCCTGDTSEQIFFATEGPGGTGKGVAFETLTNILGTYAQAVKAEMFLLTGKGDSATGDNSVAAIRGARLCLSSEINPGARLNEARVKELTGQDTIQARFLYQEFFNFTPVAKFWLRCNGLPSIAGGDSGIWRRIRLLPFKRVVEVDKKDPYLRDKLKEEVDGILTWAIEGARLWLRDRLNPPALCTAEAMRYREDMDLVGLWLFDRCSFDEDAVTMSSNLYLNYLEWCELQGEKAKSQRWLSFELRQRGLNRIRVANGSAYQGVRLKNDGMLMDRELF